MSRVFYDHLINFKKLENRINKISGSHDEKLEYWLIIDEIIHHRIMVCILDNLSQEYHGEFISLFHKCPYDVSILDFIEIRSNRNMSGLLKKEIKNLEKEIDQVFK